MDIKEKALKKHYEWHGKIEVKSRVEVKTAEDLSTAYTPGVAQPCLEIEKNEDLSYSLTRRSNLVAVITDGSAILGLGNIGPVAGMPVMEGKCVLFKEFADVDAFPLCNSNNAFGRYNYADRRCVIDKVVVLFFDARNIKGKECKSVLGFNMRRFLFVKRRADVGRVNFVVRFKRINFFLVR